VENISTVIVVQLLQSTQEIVIFPLAMSSYYYRLKNYVQYTLLGRQADPMDKSLEEMRLHRLFAFFFLCMAQRITIVSYPLSATILYFNYNKSFFLGSAEEGVNYDQTLSQCAVMLVIEWTGSTIVSCIIYYVYRLNPLTVPANLLQTRHFRNLALFAAVHTASDVLLTKLRYDLIDLPGS
jgi:hypothetical protein